MMSFLFSRPGALWSILAGCVLGGSPTSTLADALDFNAALAQMNGRSDQRAASRHAVRSAELRREAMQGLGGPSVHLSGTGYAYSANLNLDLDALQRAEAGLSAQLPPWLGGGTSPLPQLPDRYTLQRNNTNATASVAAVWPIYVGGASDAVRGLLGAQAREAQADDLQTENDLSTQLVQRYFGAQLAERAAALHAQALRTITEHDSAAQKMLDAGVIARVERLQARAALEDARRQAQAARDDADLAANALARTVRADAPVQPSSPLFVHHQPVQPLAYFLNAALLHHPGLDKVAAKKTQAEQLHAAQEALRRPQVLAFGQRRVHSGPADWVAGVTVRWTLWDAIDRNALAASSLEKVAQAERSGAQARSDIVLLVEKNWLATEQARRQYFAQQASAELADEVLRLRQAGLREGTSTTLDLIDAQVNQTKVQTERAQTANAYVQALAALLASCGLSEQFGQYMAQADVKVQ